MKHQRRNKSGFTLVELLVSIAVFVVFLGVVASSYVNIVRSQRQANLIRKMYSQVRIVMDQMATDTRLGTIDYDCYEPGLEVSTCPPEVKNIAQIAPDGMSSVLVIVNKDHTLKTVYRFDPVTSNVTFKRYIFSVGGWITPPEFNPDPENAPDGFLSLLGGEVKVKNLAFAIYPPVNPYSQQHALQNHFQFQPKVTAFLTIENGSPNLPPFHLDLQTTFSSRVYSRL